MSDAAEPNLTSVNFSSFVISLASSALVHLGDAPDPATGERAADLPLARHSIDLLGMMEEKTRGNLDDEEAKLLASVLDELRGKFVEAARRG